jgi:hypothetical protein
LAYWNRDASLNYARVNHEAVLLANGNVMVSGGRSDSYTIIQVCEYYSPSTGWQLGAIMKNPRFYYTLTPFANNTKVLAAGSAEPASQPTAEIYDSSVDTWTSTATNMSNGRFAHGAALLNIPSTNSFMRTNDMNIGRILFTTTLLNDGSTVLITGGGDIYSIMTATAEVYRSDSWTLINNFMTQRRAYHAAVLLGDGTVLIAGGGNGAFVSYSTAEIYNPTTNTFTSVGSMNYRRALFTLTLLPSGNVLATGGIDWTTNTYPAICELYDPVTQTWSKTQILNNGRSFHRSVLLNDSVLTIGGYIMPKNQSKTCEKYEF